jgi:hypothetical protein
VRGNSLTSPRLPSRVKGSHSILKRLRAVVIANARTLVGRELDEDAQRWHHRVSEFVTRLVDEGDRVLPPCRDPRDCRRVRKRPGSLL